MFYGMFYRYFMVLPWLLIQWNSLWESWAIAGPKALSDGSSGMDRHGPLVRGAHWSDIFDDFRSKTPSVPIGFPSHFSLEGKANNKALIEWYSQLIPINPIRNAHETHRSKGPPITLTQVGSLNLFQVRFSCCFYGAKKMEGGTKSDKQTLW